MFRQYRKLEAGEFLLAGGDCSQGGSDSNTCVFISKTKLDIPLVYHSRGVAAQMTAAIQPVLESIFDSVGVKPTVCFERNNGGASEMERLEAMNRLGKYNLFVMPRIGQKDEGKDDTDTKKLGWDTNITTRPILLGDWLVSFNREVLGIYDEEILKEHKTFIVNKHGKPEASKGKHDDLVFGCAIGWQLYNRCDQSTDYQTANQAKFGHNYEDVNKGLKKKWNL